jgi:hypothetical protein
MKVDADFTRGASRLIYPELLDPLTSVDLILSDFLVRATRNESGRLPLPDRQAPGVVLLVQLKVFQAVGRFLNVRAVPRLIFEHVAHRLGVDGEIGFESSESTQHRHHKTILDRLGVTAAQCAECSFAGRLEQSYGKLQRSIRGATFGRSRLSASSRILLTGRYDRFCVNLPCGPKGPKQLPFVAAWKDPCAGDRPALVSRSTCQWISLLRCPRQARANTPWSLGRAAVEA